MDNKAKDVTEMKSKDAVMVNYGLMPRFKILFGSLFWLFYVRVTKTSLL